MKTCSKCKISKAYKDFQNCSASKDGLQYWCRECSNKANIGYKLMYRYGITVEDKENLILAQHSRCAICSTDNPTSWGWCVEHDHKTGRVRGILCHECNLLVGRIERGYPLYVPDVDLYIKNY